MLKIMEKANYLVFPSLLLKNWMESYFPVIENKSLVIPHQMNSEKIENILPNFFIQNQFSLLHGGNLLAQRNPKFLIEAYINFLNNYPEAKNNTRLYLIGGNSYHSKLLEKFEENSNIFILSFLDYKTMQSLENNATVNIILEAVSEISPFLPGKFPNCVKANKPILVLGPYYSEVRRLLGNDYTYWSEANDTVAIENNINKLYQIWLSNSEELILDRPDLTEYSSVIHLKKTIESITSIT
jgi:hypothetical protein